MLIHHTAEDYGVAAQKAADWATKKLNKIIAEGKEKAISTIEEVQNNQPRDYLVPSSAIGFTVNKNRLEANWPPSRQFKIHPYALEQIGERCGMPNPKKVMNWIMDDDSGVGASELAGILNRKFADQKYKRFLVRCANDHEVRGFLSDRYRRLDSAPLVESFVKRAAEHGALPIEGKALDTKFYLKVVLPHILEPIPGEVMLWGAQLKNSDFGDGKLDVSGFVYRLRCTNLLMGEDGFSKVHLGGRLDENMEFSERTYKLDTKTMASAVVDVVDSVLEPSNVKKNIKTIQLLAETNTDSDAVLKVLRTKSKLTKGEAEEAAKIFNSAEIEKLPPGQNAWRLSNAIALLSQQSEPARQLELEKVAGEVAGLRKAV
jgi:hypothetical protein